MLEYQESIMAQNIKPNNTGYFSRTLFEKILRILKESKYVLTLAKLFFLKVCGPIHSILFLLPLIPPIKISGCLFLKSL